MMKTPTILGGMIASVALCANGQGFVNFDFEQATVVTTYPQPWHLDWDLAVPGWNHSTGSDTSTVFWRGSHTGTTQSFVLIDSRPPFPYLYESLAGKYSLMFSSGIYSLFDPIWVNAYISQTPQIPSDSLSLRMLATGPFEVRVGGVEIPMHSLGGNSYGGDISAFAGSLVEVKIINTATTVGVSTVVDNVMFSPMAIPEPKSFVLGLTGALFLMFRRHKNAA
jgi:hypothetical protein